MIRLMAVFCPSSIFDQKDMKEVSDYVREVIIHSLKDEKIAS
ncbi:hypothetical protein ACVBAX_03185 [Robertmurraya sp. GLU-23]